MSLFMGEIAKGNFSEAAIKYFGNVDEIARLAQLCFERLELSDPSSFYFEFLRHIKGYFMDSFTNLPPIIGTFELEDHLAILRLIASYYNRGIGLIQEPQSGISKFFKFIFTNDTTDDLVCDIDIDPTNPKIKDIFPDLLNAMKTQINYANSLRLAEFW